jgi:hypothetical protein
MKKKQEEKKPTDSNYGKQAAKSPRRTRTGSQCSRNVLTEHMRKRIISLVHRRFIHLKQAAVRVRTTAARRVRATIGTQVLPKPALPLAASAPLFQPTPRPSKFSLRRSSSMLSSASLITGRFPAAVLGTTSMCSPSRSRSCTAISVIVWRVSALALLQIGALNLPGGGV